MHDRPFDTGATGQSQLATTSLTATDLAAAIATGARTAEQTVLDLIARIEAVNPNLNAVVAIRPEALEEARRVDSARERGVALPALAGVPISVKAEIDVEGSASSSGVEAWRDFLPESDAPVVSRMRAAGAIVLARTNQPDLGLRNHTDSGLYGPTVNPWDPSITPGGSSGGDAVAIATGMVPLGLGSDLGGSLRNPATCVGIAALKPGLGRIPVAYSGSAPSIGVQLMCVQGPMARSVADLRLALGILEGSDPRDPWSLPVATRQPQVGKGKIAVMVDGVAPPVAEAVRKAADVLSDAGYSVAEVSPPDLDRVFNAWGALAIDGLFDAELQAVLGQGVRTFLHLVGDRFDSPSAGHPVSVALEARYELFVLWSRFFDTHGLILGPVWTTMPWGVDYDLVDRASAVDVLYRGRLTNAANLLGLPSATVPVTITDGVPIGVQIMGPQFAEVGCLDAAAAIEASLGSFTPIDPRLGTSTSSRA